LYHVALDAQDTSGLRVTKDPSMPMRDASYSTDGQWIAFETWQTGSNHEIYMMTTSGTQIQPLVNDPLYDFDPAFRP
jgi:Tol biopolymer transport system component